MSKELKIYMKESFLRMNKPSFFGDDLKNIRPMISKMVNDKKFITGYEEGKYTGGYRYIYPIFYNIIHMLILHPYYDQKSYINH